MSTLDEDAAVTMYTAPIWPHQTLLACGLTACGVVAGPALLGAAQTAPALALASAAIGLTALLIGFALRQSARHATVAVPRRRIRTLQW